MPPAPAQFDRIATVTIQGGGVYGMSLLGQLRGVLDAGYIVAGLAGTSAGAIVAALHWAGLEPEQIRDEFKAMAGRDGGLTVLLGSNPPVPGAFRVERLNRLTAAGGRARAAVRDLRTGPWWSRLAHWLILPLRPLAHLGTILQSVCDGYRGWRAVQAGGLFSGAEFERTIDRLLRKSPKLAPHLKYLGVGEKDPITFGHVRRLLEAAKAYFPALVLTGTDLSTGELLLFDSTNRRFDDVPVAKAVRASGGFPLFFEPVHIDLPDPLDPATGRDPGTRHVHSLVDGGLICNFPGFVFASRDAHNPIRRRSIYEGFATRPMLNLGLRLRNPPVKTIEPRRDPGQVVAAVWDMLSLQTRTYLETRLAESTVERLVSIGQLFAQTGWPGGVMEVDKLTPKTIDRMFVRGRAFARKALRVRAFARPLADEIEPALHDLVAAAVAVFGQPDNGHTQIRATLFVPDGGGLQLAYRANMDDPARDTDRDLRLEFWQGLVGFCFTRRRPVLSNLLALGEAFAAGELDPEEAFGLTPEIQARIRKDRSWLMSVPVYDPLTAFVGHPGGEPEVIEAGPLYAEMERPVDAALFGVLSLDAGFDYTKVKLAEDAAAQAADPRVLALRDTMLVAAWGLGQVFSYYFGAVPNPE